MKKLLAALLFVPAMAHAEFYTGNEIYMKMTNDSSIVDRTVAMGYVVGVYDVGVHLFFCPKTEQGITVGQIGDMVKNWLYSNPHRRNELAQKLILDVFKQTWPCPNRTPSRGA